MKENGPLTQLRARRLRPGIQDTIGFVSHFAMLYGNRREVDVSINFESTSSRDCVGRRSGSRILE